MKICHWKKFKGWYDNKIKGRIHHFAEMAKWQDKDHDCEQEVIRNLTPKQHKMEKKGFPQKVWCPKGMSTIQFAIYTGHKRILLFLFTLSYYHKGLNSITEFHIGISIKFLLMRIFFLIFRIIQNNAPWKLVESIKIHHVQDKFQELMTTNSTLLGLSTSSTHKESPLVG